MAKPDKTERFKVTEREAGTGRVVHEMQGDAPVLSAASRLTARNLKASRGRLIPLRSTPIFRDFCAPQRAAEFLPSRFCRRVCRLLEQHRRRPHR